MDCRSRCHLDPQTKTSKEWGGIREAHERRSFVGNYRELTILPVALALRRLRRKISKDLCFFAWLYTAEGR